MRTISKDELAEILNKHKMWLNGEVSGVRADLYGTDLRWADLCRTDLRGANLYEADLRWANLSGANLSEADLSWANLSRTDLSWADLSEANLYEADLHEADLYEVDLRGAKNLKFPIACPEKGTFTAFKKAGKYIIELEIPDDALRSSSTTRKCRCSKAKVISITNLDGTPSDVKSVASGYDSKFIYTIGETVEVPNFDTNRWNECAPGIHFFITRQEAVEYGL